jgi:hypothetical protein
MRRDFVPRPKDVHAGAFVIKTRGKKKYVYQVARIGKKVSSVYLGPFYDEAVLHSFIEHHKKRIQRLEEKLAFHRGYLELAEKELTKMQAIKSQLERYGAVVPNK